MPMLPNHCSSCKFYRLYQPGMPSFCEAFPDGDGIPVVILSGLNPHVEKLGNEPVVWELNPARAQQDKVYWQCWPKSAPAGG